LDPVTMPTIRCPQCNKPTPRRLDDVSDNPAINYFCCRGCGHLWTTRKGSSKALHSVRPLAKMQRSRRSTN